MKKAIWIVLVFLWMSTIFWFSSKPAEQSSKMSMSVGKTVGEIFVKDFSRLTKEKQMEFAENIDYFVRKTAHFTEYAVLGILLGFMYATFGFGGKRHFLFSAASGIFYAATDEFHQLFVDGRSGRCSDVLIDGCGIIAGLGLYIICKKFGQRWKTSL